jgi:anaerobic magnesium-protoporphyrin IX monomethyl ester cyclase
MRIGFYAPCNEFNRQAGPLMGIAYIASYLAENLGLEDVFLEVNPERLLERKPDLIAISAFSEKYKDVIRATQLFRKERPDAPLILGGPHISALPHSLHPLIDVGVIGEGEKPMHSLVQHLLQGKSLRSPELDQIQNLVYWNPEGQLQRTVFEDRIKDLDALPLPRRDIMRAWWPSLEREVVFDRGVYSSRGCSFRCHFCMYSERANLIRYVSIDKVMEDILQIVSNYPEQRHIIFYDDLFVTKKSRLKELADAIRSEKLHQRVSFGCMAKTSFFDQEYAMILRDMNIRVISWGFESGADRVLHYLKDRHSSVRKHQQAVDICNRYGIFSGGYFIVGSSLETTEEMAKTYWFIRKNQPRMPLISVFPLIPLPGTSLWQETQTRGLIDPDFDNWEHLEFLHLDPQHYLHLNQNYTLPELKDAYDNKFNPLMQWTSRVFSQVLEYEKLLEAYFKQVIPQVLNLVDAGKTVLEWGRGDRWLSYALENHAQLKTEHWSEANLISTEPAPELLILTHVLEKFGLDSAQWQAAKDFSGPVYLLVENGGHLLHLLNLLQGSFPSPIEELDMFKQNYRFTLRSLLKTLKQTGFQVRQIHKYKLPEQLPDRTTLQSLLQSMSQVLPLQEFIEDMDVFSYGLLIECL